MLSYCIQADSSLLNYSWLAKLEMEGWAACIYYYKRRSRLGTCDPDICRVKQEDGQFKTSLGYMARPYCKREGKKEKGKKGGREEKRREKMHKKNTEINSK